MSSIDPRKYELIKAAAVGTAVGISSTLASGFLHRLWPSAGQICDNRTGGDGGKPAAFLLPIDSAMPGSPGFSTSAPQPRRYDYAKAAAVGLAAGVSAAVTTYIVNRFWPTDGRKSDAADATGERRDAGAAGAGEREDAAISTGERPLPSTPASSFAPADSVLDVGHEAAAALDGSLPAQPARSSSSNAASTDGPDASAVQAAESAATSVSTDPDGPPRVASIAYHVPQVSRSPKNNSQANRVNISSSPERLRSSNDRTGRAESKSSQDYCAKVRSYYTDNVAQAVDAVKGSRDIVTREIGAILQFLNNKDNRFHRNPVATGGMKEALNVDIADEFDYNIKLNYDTSHWQWGTPSPANLGSSPNSATQLDCLVIRSSSSEGREVFPERMWKWSKQVMDPMNTIDKDVTIITATSAADRPPAGFTCVLADCLTGQQWTSFCHENTVVPFYIRRTLHQLLEQAIKVENHPRVSGVKDVMLKRKHSGPVITVTITCDQKDPINVDLCPYFDLPHLWPQGSDWPRHTTLKWLHPSKINSIKAKGVQLVPKRNFDFRISFCLAETEILDGIDKDGGCRKKCARIIKRLNEKVWCNTIKPTVSSYVLKNLLLWECEKMPSRNEWADDMLWDRVRGLAVLLHTWIKDRSAPQYFYPAVDLFADSDPATLKRVGNTIDQFLNEPSKYLQQQPSAAALI